MSEDTKEVLSERTKTGLEILEAAVLLGILGDALLRSVPLGINVLLWMIAFVAAAAALIVRRRQNLKTLENGLLYVPLIIFSTFFAWRDSNTLMLLNVLAILLTLTMITLRGQNIAVRLSGFVQYALGSASLAIDAAFAPFYLLFEDVKWKMIPRNKWTKHLFSALRGLMIAVPLIFIFGALFMAADAVFAGIVKNTFNISPEILLTHGFLIALFSWTTAGFLRGVIVRSEILRTFASNDETAGSNAAPSIVETKVDEEKSAPHSVVENVIHQSDEPKPTPEVKNIVVEEEKTDKPFFSLGIVEAGIVLGLMNLLFLSFVIVQVRYFFGGAEFVQQITEMTYADYARRGFFELAWVAALVLPILLIIQYLLRKDNPLNEKLFRLLAGGQIILLFVIMASALKRMFLYQGEYGLTELRVYTTAFMFWLAIVFVIFTMTVLIGKRQRFAFAAYLSALLVVATLHVINPDALIVRVNYQRLNEGKYFDAQYASKLSADAISYLADELPNMSQENRCIIKNSLLDRKDYESNTDWRSWNLARRRAWNTIEVQSVNWNPADCPRSTASYRDDF